MNSNKEIHICYNCNEKLTNEQFYISEDDVLIKCDICHTFCGSPCVAKCQNGHLTRMGSKCFNLIFNKKF